MTKLITAPSEPGRPPVKSITTYNFVKDPETALQEYMEASGRASRFGIWAIGLGFGGFLLWAGLAPLDEGVPSQGTVSIDTKRKPIQHLTGGIVKDVLVGEGSQVTAGQVLLRLDDGTAKANFEAMRQRNIALRAAQDRLKAENMGAPAIDFNPELKSETLAAFAQAQIQSQTQLFEARKRGLAADLQAIEESIKGSEASMKALESIAINRRNQISMLSTELKSTRELVKDGYAPSNRLFELERSLADNNSSLADVQGSLVKTTHAIAEAKQRAISRRAEFRKEIETQLAEANRELEGDVLKLKAASEDLSRVEIKAPVAGQVVGLAVQAQGSVVSPGQKLMDIVPIDESLLVETYVTPNLIDQVRTGLLVDIRFAGFAHSPQLLVQGKLVSVSKDLIVEPQPHAGHYLARVEVTPEGRIALGKHQLQPGMPVEVVLKTGERTLLEYLLHPLTKRMASAMKEE